MTWRRVTYSDQSIQIPRVDLMMNNVVGAMGKHRIGPIVAKTADYTVTQDDSGTVFTTYGASGAVTFTLPAKAAGLVYTFVNAVNQNMQVTADAANTMVAFNDTTTCDGVIFSTLNEKTGAAVKVICDGTDWIAIPQCKNTMTLVTG
jgi:hypothetical protein